MARDPYVRLAAGVLKLVDRLSAGRQVTLRLETDVSPSDPTKPWNPGTPTYANYTCDAVVVPIDQTFVNGTTILATDEQVIVAAQGMPAVPNMKTVVLDGSTRYQTVSIDRIAPGDLEVAYVITVRR